jgi:mannose-6-phosphate isomerase-like protein (cupin superfamily)
MPDTKYGNLIVTELKAPANIMAALPQYARLGKRILWIDTNVVKGSFQMNCSWYLHPSDRSPAPHAHDVDEIIGFFGNNPDDPWNLGAEIEFWMEDQQFIINKSALFFVPAGVKHCPLLIRRVDRPVIHFSVVTSSEYIMKDKGWKTPPASGYANYVVTELKIPPEKLAIAGDYNKYARRILWLDEHVVPGAFHMNTAWYLKAAPTLENVPHIHEHDDEIIGFLGSNPDDPVDLGGEVEIWIENERHIITRSAMVFVPAGLKHCPLILRRVDRPIFHFTTVPGKRYIKDELQ